jgi:hypothetical protein
MGGRVQVGRPDSSSVDRYQHQQGPRARFNSSSGIPGPAVFAVSLIGMGVAVDCAAQFGRQHRSSHAGKLCSLWAERRAGGEGGRSCGGRGRDRPVAGILRAGYGDARRPVRLQLVRALVLSLFLFPCICICIFIFICRNTRQPPTIIPVALTQYTHGCSLWGAVRVCVIVQCLLGQHRHRLTLPHVLHGGAGAGGASA